MAFLALVLPVGGGGGAGIDNTLPQPPVYPGQGLPNVPGLTPGWPLPQPPVHPWFPGHLGGPRPDQGLPMPPVYPSHPIYHPDKPMPSPTPPGPVDPGWGGGWGSGGRPDNSLPGFPGRPDQGLPSSPGHPSTGPVGGGWVLVFHPAYGYIWVPLSALGGGKPMPEPTPPAEPKEEEDV